MVGYRPLFDVKSDLHSRRNIYSYEFYRRHLSSAPDQALGHNVAKLLIDTNCLALAKTTVVIGPDLSRYYAENTGVLIITIKD